MLVAHISITTCCVLLTSRTFGFSKQCFVNIQYFKPGDSACQYIVFAIEVYIHNVIGLLIPIDHLLSLCILILLGHKWF